MCFDTIIINGIILTSENRYKPYFGSVGIKDGKIKYVGERALSCSDSTETIDASGKIVMPGLINGHCHGDMTLARGLGDDLTLGEQNDVFGPHKWFFDMITDDDRYYSRQLTYIEAIRSGTTFIMENMYWSLGLRSVDAMVQTGIKGALADDIRKDFSKPEIFVPDEFFRSFKEKCTSNGLVPVIGTISEEDFEDDLLKKIYAKAKELGILTTQHLSETTWRVDMIKDKFGNTPITHLDSLGVLSSSIIGSHSVYASKEEANMMAKNNVKVVNTPLCEMKIADGIAPIPEYLEAGVCVGLGTDGAMWNNSNDIFREMKGMALLHTINSGIRTLSTHDVLDMATIKGAEVFGLEDSTGSLCEGKCADIILVEATKPHMQPLRTGRYENVASSIIYSATGQDVTDVLVNGNCVMKDRIITTIDESSVIERVNRASEKIAVELQKNS